MFESSYGDGYYEGNKKGKEEGKAEEKTETTKQMILNMAKQGIEIETIADITGLTIEEIKLILEGEDG